MSSETLSRALELFAYIEDPRREHPSRLHRLQDIIAITIMATLAGASNWVEIEDWADSQEAWLREILELPHGVPSHDTFGRVFALLNPEALVEAFTEWTRQLAGQVKGVVALDGKTVRRSLSVADGRGPIHVVSAFAVQNRLVLSQVKVDDKSNEIVALPKLIKLLDLTDCTVTVDAMGCQVEVAQAVREQQGDYLLRIKDNQPALHTEVRELFEWALSPELPQDQRIRWVEAIDVDGDHGRIEQRRCVGVADLSGLHAVKRWPDVKSVWMVESHREVLGQSPSLERRFYISSLSATENSHAARTNASIRQHWGIENSLHWVLDVAMDEDVSRAREGHSATNLALMRKVALNLFRRDTSYKRGIQAKQKKAGWDRDYLVHLLGLA